MSKPEERGKGRVLVSGFVLRVSFGFRISDFGFLIMSTVNESLIRDVVAEVMGRLGGAPATKAPAPAPASAQPACARNGKGYSAAAPGLRGKFGVFQDASEACAAAHEAFFQLQQKGVAARRKIEEIIKTLSDANAEAWGKLELVETKIGRLDHKIEKLKIIMLVPG